jgi:hypothetical protein
MAVYFSNGVLANTVKPAPGSPELDAYSRFPVEADSKFTGPVSSCS